MAAHLFFLSTWFEVDKTTSTRATSHVAQPLKVVLQGPAEHTTPPPAQHPTPEQRTTEQGPTAAQPSPMKAPTAPSSPAHMPPQPFDWDAVYVPRPELSVAPAPTQAVLLPSSELAQEDGLYRAVLILYIDESGIVQHVRAEPPRLPLTLEQATIEVFKQVPFKPGEQSGVPVKSRIKIEVEFERRPTSHTVPFQ